MLAADINDAQGAIDLLRLSIELNLDSDNPAFQRIIRAAKKANSFDQLVDLD